MNHQDRIHLHQHPPAAEAKKVAGKRVKCKARRSLCKARTVAGEGSDITWTGIDEAMRAGLIYLEEQCKTPNDWTERRLGS